jgi:hypothetical protein
VRKKNASKRFVQHARLAASAMLALVCVLQTEEAFAFCRTASCAGGITGARCTPSLPTDCGTELFWESPCVGFSMQQDASSQVSLAVATDIFEKAFEVWQNVDCGGGKHPRIRAVNLGPVECNAHEYNKKAGNANIILFQDKTWPHVGGGSTLALTTVTYNVDTGEIYDADMELNSANVTFTMDDKTVKYDLASIAAHETGHFLGLSHSTMGSATMYSDYTPGSTQLRELDVDDIAAICAAYPPGDPIAASCDPSPRRGQASECSPAPIQEEKDSCSMAPGMTRTSTSLGGVALIAALGWFTQRRRNRRHT